MALLIEFHFSSEKPHSYSLPDSYLEAFMGLARAEKAYACGQLTRHSLPRNPLLLSLSYYVELHLVKSGTLHGDVGLGSWEVTFFLRLVSLLKLSQKRNH